MIHSDTSAYYNSRDRQILVLATYGRFGEYGLPNAGNCDYGNFGGLLEIH
jgi:hypothetical protein